MVYKRSIKAGGTDMRKTYTLKNGYSLCKGECYDGYQTRTFWQIWTPDGHLYMNCGSYKEAYEIASHLVAKEY